MSRAALLYLTFTSYIYFKKHNSEMTKRRERQREKIRRIEIKINSQQFLQCVKESNNNNNDARERKKSWERKSQYCIRNMSWYVLCMVFKRMMKNRRRQINWEKDGYEENRTQITSSTTNTRTHTKMPVLHIFWLSWMQFTTRNRKTERKRGEEKNEAKSKTGEKYKWTRKKNVQCHIAFFQSQSASLPACSMCAALCCLQMNIMQPTYAHIIVLLLLFSVR